MILEYFQLSIAHPLPSATQRNRIPKDEKMEIPGRTTHFTVAYPLGGVYHVDNTQKTNLAAVDASFMFLLYGGMVFMGPEGDILSAAAFLPGGDEMKFEERRQWDRRYTLQLHKER